MGRRAALVAEDRVLAVDALARVAAVAAVQEAWVLQPPVPAARRLEQIPADRAHRAQLGRGGQRARLAERLRDLRFELQLGQRRARADRRSLDAARYDAADVDQRFCLDDPVAQERDEVRAA